MRTLVIGTAALLFVSTLQAQSRQPLPDAPMKDMPGMQPASPDGQSPQAASEMSPSMNMQQPPNHMHHDEQAPPAPDLLTEVVHRPPIGLAEFLDLADKTNPALGEAEAVVHRSEARARQAGLYPNPSVGYQGEQIRGGDFGGGEHGGFVQQTIVLGGKLGLRREIYRQQGLSDEFGVDEQRYRLHNDVTQAFYAALAAQAAVVTRQKLLGVAQDAVETVHQLANVGQADTPDILQTEVEAEQAKVEFVGAQRQFLADFQALATLANKADMPARPLAGALEDLPKLDAEKQLEIIMTSSPSVARAEQEVAVANAELRDAKRESVPDLDLRAGEQYNGEQNGLRPVGAQSFASASIDIPLWNRNQGNIGAAEAELDRARQQVARTQLSVREGTEPLVQSYLSARFAADRYKTELIPRAQRAYELYLAKYQRMAQAYPQVLVSQRTLFELQIGYLHALREAWSNAIALENYGLSGILERPAAHDSSRRVVDILTFSSGTE